VSGRCLGAPGCDQFDPSLSLHQSCDPEDAIQFEFEESGIEFSEAYLTVALLDLVKEIVVCERSFTLKDLDES